MQKNCASGAQTRRYLLKAGSSGGLMVAAASLLPSMLSSKALASGRHSAPPQCVPTPASNVVPAQTFPSQLASYNPPPSAPSAVGNSLNSGLSQRPLTVAPSGGTPSNGSWASIGGGGSGGGSSPLCYLKGTRIRTKRGEVEIEQLLIGEAILTHSGKYRPLKWVGQSRYKKNTDSDWKLEVKPVCITRSAIDDNVPARDLYVSPAHAMYLEGALINAVRLINGTTIYQAAADETDLIEYFQLEFEEHEVVYAEGALAESFQAEQQREIFSNFNEFERLYGQDDRIMKPYAPRFKALRHRDVIFGAARDMLSNLGFSVPHPVKVAQARLAARAAMRMSGPL